MMRSLWTAASGMTAQQFNVDVISNNLSNVNTTAFKKDRAEFKDLLYEAIDRAYVLDGKGKPVNLQVGHGTAYVATMKDFETGNLEQTGNPLDFAIDGEAFFMVNGPKGEINYTRDGGFRTSLMEDGKKLTTSEGFPVLDDAGNEIVFNVDTSKLVVSSEGDLGYTDETGTTISLGQRIGLVKFENRQGS
jgi:flagellar basal-body rod protein FlgG